MRAHWLFIAGLLIGLIGCGGDSATSPSDTADSEADSTTSSTFWQLLDDTDLKVSVEPPLATEATLQVRRAYLPEVGHSPLKSLHYRVVTDTAPDVEWIALPESTKEDLGEGMLESIYVTAVTLPQGTPNIQFKVDQGFEEPYELTDWSIEVQ